MDLSWQEKILHGPSDIQQVVSSPYSPSFSLNSHLLSQNFQNCSVFGTSDLGVEFGCDWSTLKIVEKRDVKDVYMHVCTATYTHTSMTA